MPTSGQQLLLPDSTKSKRGQRTITVAVNSRDRNLVSDYFPNSFRWTFPRPLKDIISIELVNGSIPADIYNINTGWNKLIFGEVNTGKKWTITLEPGQYKPAALVEELQLEINGLPGLLNKYILIYNENTMRMKMVANGTVYTEYTLYFATTPYKDSIDAVSGSLVSINSPARILGFEWEDYTSVNGVLTPPGRMDLDMFLKKLYLYINADNSTEFNRIEMGGGRKGCFHIIYMGDSINGYYPLNKDTYMPIYYSSPAPIARMNTLNISLRDEFNRLVDIGWKDYTLLFEITYLE
jgi:hypothetical protein